MFRGIIVRGRVTAPIACLVMTTLLPFSAATVDAVSSVAAQDRDVALYQDAAQDASMGDGAAPATVDPPAADVAAPDQAGELAATEEGGEPAAPETAPETISKEALTDTSGAVDPAKDEGTDPAPVDPASTAGAVNPAPGAGIDPATEK